MMNTLANHGFLNRDGLNLTEDVVIQALKDGLNFDTSLSETMFEMALPANPDPNATWFTLCVALSSPPPHLVPPKRSKLTTCLSATNSTATMSSSTTPVSGEYIIQIHSIQPSPLLYTTPN